MAIYISPKIQQLCEKYINWKELIIKDIVKELHCSKNEAKGILVDFTTQKDSKK